ncbi:uncharacterized protein [Mytilus edulis]|uniref:uncharacterized protein isoform X1 n=1 Tax=Mytilus edulis TaxID=6550 RepID=UPI0039EEE9F7
MDFRVKMYLWILFLICKFGFVLSDLCYKYSYTYGYYYTTYCYGYCYGYYGFQYCDNYDYSHIGTLSIGAFVGLIIGCIIFFIFFVFVTVAICKSCTRSAGQHGRIVNPAGGVSVVQTGQQQVVQQHFNYATPTAPPVYSNMAYYSAYPPPPPQPMNEPMPPPIYAEVNSHGQQPFTNNGGGPSTKQ